jgi:hypothetical protein
MHADGAHLSFRRVSCTGNTALTGGGGALFWEGEFQPNILSWCYAGFYPDLGHTCMPHDCTERCISCEVGSYQSSEGATNACFPCPPGSYSSSVSATVCTDCSAGLFSLVAGSNSSADCIHCTAGQYASSTGTSVCSTCIPGTFSPAEGASECNNCEAGYYGATSGNTACAACEPGSFSEAGAVSCAVCYVGTYIPEGAVECVQCNAGSFSTAEGAVAETTCALCLPGSYSEELGAPTCELCKAGSYSSSVGAFSSSVCTDCSESEISYPGAIACTYATNFKAGIPLEMNEATKSLEVVLPFNISVFCSVFSRLTGITNLYAGILSRLIFVSSTAADEHIIELKLDEIASGKANLPLSMVICSEIVETSSFLEFRAEDEITLQWTNWDPDPSVTWIYFPCYFRTVQISLFRNNTLKFCHRIISFTEAARYVENISIGVYGRNFSLSFSRSTQDGICLILSPDPEACSSYSFSSRPWMTTDDLLPICPAGQYLSADASCTKCPQGTFQTSNGAISKTSCSACAAGKYSSAEGATGPDSCVVCTGSSESNESSAGTTACESVATRQDAPVRVLKLLESRERRKSKGGQERAQGTKSMDAESLDTASTAGYLAARSVYHEDTKER